MRIHRSSGMAPYYVVVTFAVALAVVLADHGGDRWWAVISAFVLLGSWFLLARPAVAPYHTNAPPAVAYTVIAFVGVALSSYVAPVGGNFILFAICPQMAMAFTLRIAIGVVVALNGVFAVADIAAGANISTTLVSAVAVALGVSFFIYVSYRRHLEGEARDALIEELRATREQTAQLRAEQAVTEDRIRISRDMHDTVAQGFASILMLIQAVETEVEDHADLARHHAGLIKRLAAENLEESRRIVAALAPAALETLSLDAAIVDVGARFAQEAAVVVEPELLSESKPLDRPVEVVALRLIQESLNNIRKHAGASTVAIRWSYGAERLVIDVTDNGTGFDPTTRGYGLRGLFGRVDDVGGEARVDSALGRGTTVHAELPLAASRS